MRREKDPPARPRRSPLWGVLRKKESFLCLVYLHAGEKCGECGLSAGHWACESDKRKGIAMSNHIHCVRSNAQTHGVRFAVDHEVARLIRKGFGAEFAFRLACQHVFGRAL